MGIKTKVKRNEEAEVVLLSEAFAEFVEEKEALNLSKATIENYIVSYRVFTEFFGFDESTSVEAINKSLFFEFMNSMKLDGVKPTTINHYLRDMRAFCYWCMDDIKRYIYPSFKITLMEAQEEQLKLFTDEEIEMLLEKPRRNDSFTTWRTWAIVNWVLATGNRAATICEVQLGDIDFRAKEITLRHTKNKKAQIIPLSNSLETVIKEYIRTWRKGAPDSEHLFCNIGGELLTTSALKQAFSQYCKDREVSRTNIHGLRHNFAKGWVKNNGNMFTLQKVLGHSSLDMTRKYVKLFSEDIKDDFSRFNPLDTIKRSSRRTQTVRRNEY